LYIFATHSGQTVEVFGEVGEWLKSPIFLNFFENKEEIIETEVERT